VKNKHTYDRTARDVSQPCRTRRRNRWLCYETGRRTWCSRKPPPL